MCLDAKAYRSYVAAKGWATRRRRATRIPFEEGGITYAARRGANQRLLERASGRDV